MNTEQKQDEYFFFFHLTSPFSNFHPSKFSTSYHDKNTNIEFCSNEQFIMYSKAITFNDKKSANDILAVNNDPLIQDFFSGKISRQEIVSDKKTMENWNVLMKKIKRFGRGVKNYNDEVWAKRRINVGKMGCQLKFQQNKDLLNELLKTHDKKMVELSPYDNIWGNGLNEYQSKRTPESQWPGTNYQGKILTDLRVYLENKNKVKNKNGIKI